MAEVKTNIKWDGPQVKVRGRKIVNKSPFESGLIIQTQTIALCPRDKSRLAGSYVTRSVGKINTDIYFANAQPGDIIPTTQKPNEAVVGTNVKYGPYVEFGTKRQKAQPHVRPAFDLSQGKVLTLWNVNGRIEFGNYLR